MAEDFILFYYEHEGYYQYFSLWLCCFTAMLHLAMRRVRRTILRLFLFPNVVQSVPCSVRHFQVQGPRRWLATPSQTYDVVVIGGGEFAGQ